MRRSSTQAPLKYMQESSFWYLLGCVFLFVFVSRLYLTKKSERLGGQRQQQQLDVAGKKCISLQEDNDRRAAIMMRKVSRNKTMEILGVASERLFMNGNQRHDIRNH